MRKKKQEERSGSIVRRAPQGRLQNLPGRRKVKTEFHAGFYWNLTWKNINLSMSVGKDRPEAAKILVTAASELPGWKRISSCLVNQA
ncbi:hypothetical protein LQE92_12255 [Lacrimispora sp. NSJ-141]|uniref:Uncharacterized protein n=1 Tax=Lientehia hominis TaxID=2897778 RepID=A0AAP2RJX5_9FIRM|nr:hypothetical protein [Lientehia hominis]MCD2493387.1 hypothetical protein [Lientehia hominis]